MARFTNLARRLGFRHWRSFEPSQARYKAAPQRTRSGSCERWLTLKYRAGSFCPKKLGDGLIEPVDVEGLQRFYPEDLKSLCLTLEGMLPE